MTCTVGPVSAIVIDVIHPGVRATGASVLALFQNLFGLAAGPFIVGVPVRRLVGLTPALAVMPAFGLVAACAFLFARAATPPTSKVQAPRQRSRPRPASHATPALA